MPHSKKTFKLIKSFRGFLIFQGLIHKIKKTIVPGSLKNLKNGLIVIYYTLYNNLLYTQLASFFVPQKDFY